MLCKTSELGQSFASLLQNILMALVTKEFTKTVEGSSELCWDHNPGKGPIQLLANNLPQYHMVDPVRHRTD